MKPINLSKPVVCAAMLAAMLASAHLFAQAPAPGREPANTAGSAQPAGVEVRDPEAVAEAVKAALRADGGPEAAGVVVSTHAETIILTGEVGSDAEVANVVSIAEATAGTLRVAPQLTLNPGRRQVADQQAVLLVRSVEEALRQDQRTADLGVAVSIDERQVVGLHGLVPTREGRTAAGQVAARVKGVREVSNRLVVPGE
jgi:osmotically-inducible protein OsmY